jgi:hypothetical protein
MALAMPRGASHAIPFIFPVAGFLLAGGGLTMVVKYVQADEAHRSKWDAWLTDALKAAVNAYIRVRYGINLGSLTAAEEKDYWREFGLRLQAFLAFAEPIAIEMYGRSFVQLTQSEQAEVIRRVARERGEEPA